MEYVNIGTDVLKAEYMNPVLDTNKLKPTGGLWCTECYPNNGLPWLNYMIDENRRVYSQKAKESDPFRHKAVFVDVDPIARIFQLRGNEAFERFQSQYRCSFENLSRSYDGVFIDIAYIFGKDSKEREYYYNLFAVSSLILFNLNVVRSYKKAIIKVDPFDFEYDYSTLVDYKVIVDPTVRYIKQPSNHYLYLVDSIAVRLRDFINKEIKNNPDEASYMTAYKVYLKIKEMFLEEIREFTMAEHLDEEKVINSIATNSLRRYK